MKKIGYEVSVTKSFRGMEGLGMNANLYRDGKKVAFIMDGGDGGGMNYEWVSKEEEAAFTAFVMADPEYASEMKHGYEYLYLDCMVGRLADASETEKKLRRLCKTKTLFLLPSDVGTGSCSVVNLPFSPAVKARILARHPDVVSFYNETL